MKQQLSIVLSVLKYSHLNLLGLCWTRVPSSSLKHRLKSIGNLLQTASFSKLDYANKSLQIRLKRVSLC